MPSAAQYRAARLAEAMTDPDRVQLPPRHPSGKDRKTRRAFRYASLLPGHLPRPRFRAPRPTPFRGLPPLDRGRPVTPEQIRATEERRAGAALRKAGRMSRRQRMELLRTGQPGATRSTLRALLHRMARDRRDGVE